MPKPTATALRKHPKALVILTYVEDQADPAAYDFEWFDTAEGLKDYTQVTQEWAAEDVVLTEGVLRYAVVQVTDTGSDPLSLGTIAAFGGDEDWRKQVVTDIGNAPGSILARRAAPAPRATKGTKAAPKKPAPKKGRKPSPAAAKAKGEGEQAPKAPPARKRAVPKGKVDRDALKQRLEDKAAAKRGDAKSESPEGSLAAFADA